MLSLEGNISFFLFLQSQYCTKSNHRSKQIRPARCLLWTFLSERHRKDALVLNISQGLSERSIAMAKWYETWVVYNVEGISFMFWGISMNYHLNILFSSCFTSFEWFILLQIYKDRDNISKEIMQRNCIWIQEI